MKIQTVIDDIGLQGMVCLEADTRILKTLLYEKEIQVSARDGPDPPFRLQPPNTLELSRNGVKSPSKGFAPAKL